MEQNENKMGVMPEGKLLITMSLPMMISMFVQALYNIVDSIFVARISEEALTAVSLAFPFQALVIAIAVGTGVGVNALVSRALGEKNSERANAIATNGLFVFAISYVVVAIFSAIAIRPFYAWQTGSSDNAIYAYGVEYLTIVMVISFGIFAQVIFERLLQATGRTVYTMISQGTGAVINIILDPILIFGLFGAPKMGIAGAAVATIIGQIIAAFVGCLFNICCNPELNLSLKGFRPDGKIIGAIYEIGVPSIIMQSIGSVMTTCMNLILISFSATAVAVFGVYFKLQSFFFMPMFGLNSGLIPILSYNFGAKRRDRMKNTLKYGYVIAFGFAFFGFICFEFIPDKLFLLFASSDEMLSIGIPALRIIGVHYLIAWYCIITGTLFQAVGAATYSLYVSVARQLVVLLPAAYILSKIGGLALVWWCFPIAEIMSLIISTVCLIAVKNKILSKL